MLPLEAFKPLGKLMVLCGKGGGAPPAPDYTGAANAEAAASKEIATQQTWANRPNQYTPWGSTTWNAGAGVDPSTGQPITNWTQQQQLNPQLQSSLDQQLAIQNQKSGLGASFMGRVADEFSQPFDWQNLPQMSQGAQVQGTGTYTQGTNAPAFADERRQYTQAMWDQMQPQHARQEEGTRTMLANQGLTPGSEAYNRELERLGQAQAGERWNAVQAGGQEQQRMNQQMLAQQQQAYGQELGANAQNFNQLTGYAEYQNKLRQQAIAEQAQARGMSLNEMNAVLNGQQVSTPQMPSFMAANAGKTPELLKAAGMQHDAAMGAYSADQQSDAALWSGVGAVAGAAAMFF
jgi:hypothetical protein